MPERRTVALFAALGLLVGGLVAVAMAFHLGRRSDIAWPVPVAVTLGSGVVAGLFVAFAVRWLRRGRLPVLTVGGVAAGLLVGLAVYLWGRYVADGQRVVYHGRYVPTDGITASKAYSSTLVVGYGQPQTWWSLMGIGGVAGLVGGLVFRVRTASR
ncbi:hypothetical protein [uncultured Jatrophihabitans sp.]|uniref:hypothetical protein n=1 Tax=uncultured Jatrophihabitans sp. TaxID=1610747 RepID=UPI0035CC14B0